MAIQLKQITLKNIGYVIQSLFRLSIIKLYRRFVGEDPTQRMYNKIEACKPCFNNGDCLECGCNFKLMVLSDKKCPKGRF